MADNTTLNIMSGGDVISSDVITTLNGGGIATGEKAQRVKVGWGADGLLNDTSGTNPLPVVQTGALPAGTAVIGKVSIDQTTPGTTNLVSLGATNVVSTANSSTATLGVGAAFTGTSEDITNYASATVLVISDVASATDGLSIQQSSNGTNWDNLDAYTVPAATGKSFAVQATAKFFRVVYTNGGTIQGSFRLQTIFHTIAGPTSSARPQDARTNDNDMQEGLAYMMGFNGTSFDRIRTKGTGVLSNDVTTINNVTPLMGNGVTGTGSQRVTIASDNTAFAVNSTLTAETTKVIGVTRTADGAGNLLTSTGSALDVNLKTSAATNISTNLAQVNGVTTLAGNGASGTGAQRVTLASDSTGQVATAANATATGATPGYTNALTNTKVAVNASAGNLYGWHIYNPGTVVTYVQLFNTASGSVTLGTTVPVQVIAVPAGGWADAQLTVPLTYGTALTVAATTTTTGLTAPTTPLNANFFIK